MHLEKVGKFHYDRGKPLKGEKAMEDANTLSVVCDRQKLSLDIRTILYIIMHENVAEIHCIGGKVYRLLTVS